MKRRGRPLLVLPWVLATLSLSLPPAAGGEAPATPGQPSQSAEAAGGDLPQRPLDVLFYGSSFTSYNDMPAMFRRLAAAADPAIEIDDHLVARPGYSLDLHWRAEQEQQHLQSATWDVVILQEQAQAPLRKRERMATYAGRFTRAVDALGGRTVLLMAWAPRRRQGMTAPLAEATEQVGREVGALVAPVGRAWHRALQERPNLGLHSADGVHPAPLGSYLTACVLLTTALDGFDPRGLPALDLDIAAADLQWLQEVAWSTVHGQ